MPIDPTRLDHNGDECFAEEFAGANEDEKFIILREPGSPVNTYYIFLRVIDLKDEPEAGRFVALTPVEEDEDPDGALQIFLFHYGTDEHGDETYSLINDEGLFARVQAAAEEYFLQVDAENENADNIELASQSEQPSL